MHVQAEKSRMLAVCLQVFKCCKACKAVRCRRFQTYAGACRTDVQDITNTAVAASIKEAVGEVGGFTASLQEARDDRNSE